jgi:hypothetical protein
MHHLFQIAELWLILIKKPISISHRQVEGDNLRGREADLKIKLKMMISRMVMEMVLDQVVIRE